MKNKKIGFTLAEVMICLMAVAVIMVICIKTLSSEKMSKEGYALGAHKAVEEISNAIAQFKQFDSDKLPKGTFISFTSYKSVGETEEEALINNDSYEYSLYNAEGTKATATELRNMLGKYLKIKSNIANFCSNTVYASACGGDPVPGFNMSGDIYIGFSEIGTINDCPNYLVADFNTKNHADDIAVNEVNVKDVINNTTKKCWGKLIVDANGKSGPNTVGVDIYVYGLDTDGIAK